MQIETIFNQFSTAKVIAATVYGNGHINKTYKIDTLSQAYILQQLNTSIFKSPEGIAHNFRQVAEHLQQKGSPFVALTYLPTLTQQDYYQDIDGQYWRLLPFITDTHSIDSVSSPNEAYLTAHAFGRFMQYLDGIDTQKMSVTIPNFHNGNVRLAAIKKAIRKDAVARHKYVERDLISMDTHASLLLGVGKLRLPTRVTHNDTKINNILFDSQGQVRAIIDWDTLMPGKVLSDFGDMIRTITATATENEADLSLVDVNFVYFEAVTEGFLAATTSILTDRERRQLWYGAQFIIYMQAVRFMTDFLQGDVYYPISYPTHNLVRARNQMKLLYSLQAQKDRLERLFQ